MAFVALLRRRPQLDPPQAEPARVHSATRAVSKAVGLVVQRVRAFAEPRHFGDRRELLDGSVADEWAQRVPFRIKQAAAYGFGWNAALSTQPHAPDRVVKSGGSLFQEGPRALQDHAETRVEQVLAAGDNGIWVRLATGPTSAQHRVVVLKPKDRHCLCGRWRGIVMLVIFIRQLGAAWALRPNP